MNILSDQTGGFTIMPAQRHLLESLRGTLREESSDLDYLITAMGSAILQENRVVVVDKSLAEAAAQSMIDQFCNNFVFFGAQRIIERIDNMDGWIADLQAGLQARRNSSLLLQTP